MKIEAVLMPIRSYSFSNSINQKVLVIVGDTPEELDNLLIAEGYTFAEGAARAPEFTPAPGTMQPAASGGSSGTSGGGTESGDGRYGVLEPVKPLSNISAGLTSPAARVYIQPKWITRISPADYAKYWDYSDTVVVCEDNYQLVFLHPFTPLI